MRSRTARVMTTLMRNGRTVDRTTRLGQRELERVLMFGTDPRITSGPAAEAAASRRRQASEENRPYTWLAPDRSQNVRFPLHRERRP